MVFFKWKIEGPSQSQSGNKHALSWTWEKSSLIFSLQLSENSNVPVSCCHLQQRQKWKLFWWQGFPLSCQSNWPLIFSSSVLWFYWQINIQAKARKLHGDFQNPGPKSNSLLSFQKLVLRRGCTLFFFCPCPKLISLLKMRCSKAPWSCSSAAIQTTGAGKITPPLLLSLWHLLGRLSWQYTTPLLYRPVCPSSPLCINLNCFITCFTALSAFWVSLILPIKPVVELEFNAVTEVNGLTKTGFCDANVGVYIFPTECRCYCLHATSSQICFSGPFWKCVQVCPPTE